MASSLPPEPEAQASGASEFSRRTRARSLAIYESFYFRGQSVSRRFQPLGKYVAGFGVAAFLMSTDPSHSSMRFAFATVLALFLIGILSGWLRKPRSVRLTRILPERVSAGESFEYTILAQNTSRFASPAFQARDHGKMRFPNLAQWYRSDPAFLREVNAFDRWAGYPKWLYLIERSQEVIGADVVVPPLAPGQSISIPARGISHRRGERLFLGFYCGLPDPFGLMRKLFFIRERQSLVVLPRPKPCDLQAPFGSRARQQGNARELARTGDSEEFRSLREWRSGDPLKRIDWKATARYGSPVSREFAPEFFLRTAVALDTFAPTPQDEEALDEGISRAAGLLARMDRKESNIDLLFMEDRIVQISLGQGRQDHIKALDSLARSAPSRTDGLDALEMSLLSHSQRFSGAVLIFPQWDARREAFCQRLASAGMGLAILLCQPSPGVKAPPGARVEILELSEWES